MSKKRDDIISLGLWGTDASVVLNATFAAGSNYGQTLSNEAILLLVSVGHRILHLVIYTRFATANVISCIR
jgi:hypothetical protein